MKGKNSSYWATVKKGEEGVPFFVKDNTGSVLVDPNGAKIDIPVLYQCRSGSGKSAPKMILAFCAAQNIRTKGFLFNRTMRYKEYRLEQGHKLYIMGTAGDNPFVEDTTGSKNEEDIMIHKGKNEKFYYISDKPEKDVLWSLRWKVIGGLFGGGALTVACLAFILFRLGLF